MRAAAFNAGDVRLTACPLLADDLRELLELAPQPGAGEGFLVERRLEVLDGEHEVEHAHVLLRRGGRDRQLRQAAPGGQAADGGSAADERTAQELCPRGHV
jgi:hypothetical protein